MQTQRNQKLRKKQGTRAKEQRGKPERGTVIYCSPPLPLSRTTYNELLDKK